MVRAYEAQGYAVASVDGNGVITMQFRGTDAYMDGTLPNTFAPNHQRVLIYNGVSLLNRTPIGRTHMPILDGRALVSVHEGVAHFRRIGELTAKEARS